VATIEESKQVTNGIKSAEDILRSFGIILELQRELLELSDDARDEGTNALMSDYIREQ
jgi:starvation-inducible DNA-binding protein